MITKKEVKHIAKLARLGLSEKEITKMQKELSKILDYIEKLKEVETREENFKETKIEKNIMRKDRGVKRKKNESKKLFRGAPKTKDGYLKVKSIL